MYNASAVTRALMERHGYIGAFFGHFGQGCLHVRIDYDPRTAPGSRNFRAFLEEAADLVVRYGGSFSGEHRFSCREHISQATQRRALHLAEVLQIGRTDGSVPA